MHTRFTGKLHLYKRIERKVVRNKSVISWQQIDSDFWLTEKFPKTNHLDKEQSTFPNISGIISQQFIHRKVALRSAFCRKIWGLWIDESPICSANGVQRREKRHLLSKWGFAIRKGSVCRVNIKPLKSDLIMTQSLMSNKIDIHQSHLHYQATKFWFNIVAYIIKQQSCGSSNHRVNIEKQNCDSSMTQSLLNHKNLI